MQTYSYEEAVTASVEYFHGDDLAAKVFVDKYALRNNDQELLEKTPSDMHRRIAKEFARIEAKKFKKPMHEQELYEYLDRFKRIVPQGSPMYGIGNNFQTISLSNCYELEAPLDSYGGIHRTDEQLSQISKRRGGCGTDITHLRPDGATTKNAARTSTGIIPFMERFSNSIREVGQAGRRGALMLTLHCQHPQVLDFAKIKRDLSKITGANISIRFSDEFMEAVDKKIEVELRWPVDSPKPEYTKTQAAYDVWHTIVGHAHAMAEPGILFWDNIIRNSPADSYSAYGFKTIGVNPCAELPLCALDSCRLLLLNMLSYVKQPWTRKATFDFESFYSDTMVAQRLMDDMVDLELEKIDGIINKIENDPEPMIVKQTELDLWKKIRKMCETGRRTGTGITALGDTMAALGLRYGSKKCVETVDEIYKNLKHAAYEASITMAEEIGPFPIYDKSLEKTNEFLNRLKEERPDLAKRMEKSGRRNIALLTTAPAGSVSILTQTTSGIEPLFMPFYTRKKKINPADENARTDEVDATGDHWQHFFVLHPQLKNWADVNNVEFPRLDDKPEKVEKALTKIFEQSPWYNCCAEDLYWKSRVDLQAVATKHVDHSISSTINLPEDVTVEEVENIYMYAWKSGCKGITVYRKNCRTGVLVETKKATEKSSTIEKTMSPKRPKELPADVHHVTVKGQQYFIMVGKLNDDPYEVFAGKNGFIPRSVKTSTIKKIRRGVYEATLENGQIVDNINEYVSDDQEAITRLTSASLRHGADISFIVHQLEKTKGDMQSFSKATARALKKHIPDGTEVSGEECPSCGSHNLQRREGCVQCMDCGWSRCC